MLSKIRTDLAVEAQQLWHESMGSTTQLEGVAARHESSYGFGVSTVDILDPNGAAALGKPVGSYVTLELDCLMQREENAFERACSALSEQLKKMLDLENNVSVLVVGLGNRSITPDAIGPETVSQVMVTNHLRSQLPEYFGSFRPVSAICSGVLGTTGMESGALVSAVCGRLQPGLVIAVDALAARDPERLCRNVQLTNTGIVPGSGVGNAREALNKDTLGVPVIAIGVPTVVDAATLAADLAANAGTHLDKASLGNAGGMIVTPRDIDKNVKDISKLIGYSLNLALHAGLTISDIDMFLS